MALILTASSLLLKPGISFAIGTHHGILQSLDRSLDSNSADSAAFTSQHVYCLAGVEAQEQMAERDAKKWKK